MDWCQELTNFHAAKFTSTPTNYVFLSMATSNSYTRGWDIPPPLDISPIASSYYTLFYVWIALWGTPLLFCEKILNEWVIGKIRVSYLILSSPPLLPLVWVQLALRQRAWNHSSWSPWPVPVQNHEWKMLFFYFTIQESWVSQQRCCYSHCWQQCSFPSSHLLQYSSRLY